MKKLETLRMQKLAGLITESTYRKIMSEIESSNFIEEEEDAEKILKDTPDDIEATLAKFLKMSPDELEQQVLNSDPKEEVNEALALTVLLALPMLLELAGAGLNKMKALSLTGEDKKFYEEWKQRRKAAKDSKNTAQLDALKKEYQQRFASKFGEGLIGAGHALHKAYTWPIVQALRLGSLLPGKFGDWAKDPKSRQKIADIMYAAGMLFYGGIHAKAGIEGLLSSHGVDATNFTTSVIDTMKSGKSLKDVVAAALEIGGAASK